MAAKLSTRIDRIRDRLAALSRDLAKARNRHGVEARDRVREALRQLDHGSDAAHYYQSALARRNR